MNAQAIEWHYQDDVTGQLVGPISLSELDALRRDGRIEEFTYVINSQMLRQQGPMARGIPYSMISRVDVNFSPAIEEFYADRAGKSITVLSGPNNCGKTLLLKQVYSLVGQGGYLIACNRFSHVDALNTRKVDEYEHRRYYDNFIQNFQMSQQNTEQNELQLEQVITSLKDHQREKLFDICKELLGNQFSLKRTDPENTFSPFYVDMDGENLRYGSSGTRLLLTLLGILMDGRFSVILIDEPEIGLSPRIQAALVQLLYDQEQRQKFFPHLRQLYIATHSHLFLDRAVLSNNFIVTKLGSDVSVRPVESVGDLHQLQFKMLGNELESLFLPSAIVIVEGDSDVTFLTKVVQMHISDKKVAIVRAGGDGEVQKKLNVLRDAFGDLETNPYRDRLFVVLDKTHSASHARIENQGVPKENITVWSENGIEYMYPQSLVAEVFCCDIGELRKIDFERDPIEFNGIGKSKKELAQIITEGMTHTSLSHPEVAELIGRIRAACN